MRLAIVHYHLQKGGVTRVIASALEALGNKAEKVVILSSTQPEEPFPCPVAVIPELAYTSAASEKKAAQLHKALVEAATHHLGQAPDIWHIHNHCLGKNVNVPEVLRRLLDAGSRVLLQIHDFSEDGRPDNYAAQRIPYLNKVFDDYDRSLFPVAPQIGYAVLNGRDRDILQQAGIPESRVFWLPNAVIPPPSEGAVSTPVHRNLKEPFFLYPTRAIRRKNVGELLLLAASLEKGKVATTLTPKNPKWIPIHDAWRKLARELSLPVEFGLGERAGNSFTSLIASSTALISTSVGEGFGLAFLEPWLMGKCLIGRDLPEVTNDFKHNGINMDGLYRRWPVPVDLLQIDGLRQRFQKVLGSTYSAYGQVVAPKWIDEAFDDHTKGGQVDFGFLDEAGQAEVLRNIRKKGVRLPVPFSMDRALRADIRENASTINNLYGRDHYKSQLQSIYSKLLASDTGPIRSANPAAILTAFLNPRRFSFLRS